MNEPPRPPRLYCIVATAAPSMLVFQRGPGKRWGLHRVDLSTGNLETGASFSGTLYPRRCDLSPDGKLLCYFALKGSGGEFMGQRGVKTYSAVSKAPWLFALAAWPEDGTWTRGAHFQEGAATNSAPLGPPQHGDLGPLAARHRLALVRTNPLQYATERRRGWVEDSESPQQGANDVWDERRKVVLTKRRPAGKHAPGDRLILRDEGIQARGGIEGRSPSYSLERRGNVLRLDNVGWADWDQFGRLLAATRDGRVQIRDADSPDLKVMREHELSRALPNRPAPAWARSW